MDVSAALKYKNRPSVAFSSNSSHEPPHGRIISKNRHKSVQHQLRRTSISGDLPIQDDSNFLIDQIKAQDIELLQEIRVTAKDSLFFLY